MGARTLWPPILEHGRHRFYPPIGVPAVLPAKGVAAVSPNDESGAPSEAPPATPLPQGSLMAWRSCSGRWDPRGAPTSPGGAGRGGAKFLGPMRIRLLLAAAVAALAAAAPAAADEPARRGAPGRAARVRLLRGPVDGVRGPGTDSAIRAFQRENGLPADGVAGKLTRRALGRLGAPLFGRRTLARGRVGLDVSGLQFLLARNGLRHRRRRVLRRADRGRGPAVPEPRRSGGRRRRGAGDARRPARVGARSRASGSAGELRRAPRRLADRDRRARTGRPWRRSRA